MITVDFRDMWNTHTCLNFNGGLVKPLLLGHGWVITFHFMGRFNYASMSVLVWPISVDKRDSRCPIFSSDLTHCVLSKSYNVINVNIGLWVGVLGLMQHWLNWTLINKVHVNLNQIAIIFIHKKLFTPSKMMSILCRTEWVNKDCTYF